MSDLRRQDRVGGMTLAWVRRNVADGLTWLNAWLARHAMHPRGIVDPRFPTRPLLRYRTALGTYYVPAHTYLGVIESAMRRGKVFEPEVVAVAREHIRPGTTVLDIGASFGQMALLFASMVGGSGRVLAFEADEYVHAVLVRNFAANGASNVVPYHRAVSDRSGLRMFLDAKDFSRFRSYGYYGIDPGVTTGESAESLAVDDLELTEPVSFMKVDAQGSDLFALRGAQRTIQRHGMPVLFEYEERFQAKFGTTFQDYMDFLETVSYRVVRTVLRINYLAVPK